MNGSDGFRIAFVGFGEAARAFLGGWGLGGSGRVRAYDVKPAAEMAPHYGAAGVAGGGGLGETLADAVVVFCLVTADQALAAAEAAAPHLRPGQLWLDGNSCSPGSKRAAAAVVEAAGAAYVDMAIMAPVLPKRHRTPLLLSGPEAAAAGTRLQALGMDWTVAGQHVGDASTIKMLRSVMIKGIEALTAEFLLAARRAGADEAVLASLQASDPGFDWAKRAAYSLERMMVHGGRRAAEMTEAAATLRELGLPDRMAAATATWQAEIGALGLAAGEDAAGKRADRILTRLGRP